MGAIIVQAKYEKTADPKRMMTHALLNEAIRKDWDAIKAFLPARTATYVRYEKGAKNAVAWNEGGKETRIDLPLQNGWYVPDGNPFAIPNGKPGIRTDQDALYLYRHQNGFSGPLGRGYGWCVDIRWRVVFASDDWSVVSGVALVGGRDVTVGLQLVRNPTELIVRGTPEQLDAAVRLLGSLKQ